MPTYDVIINATGIDLPSVDDPIIGFTTTRRLKAADEQEAIKAAKTAIAIEWRDGGYQPRNRASAPVVEVEGIVPLSFWKRLTTKAPKRGFTFYTLPD